MFRLLFERDTVAKRTLAPVGRGPLVSDANAGRGGAASTAMHRSHPGLADKTWRRRAACGKRWGVGTDSRPFRRDGTGANPWQQPAGRSSAWLERLVWDQEVASSNLAAPTSAAAVTRSPATLGRKEVTPHRDDAEPIQWAPKVERDKIRRLYETDAKGIVDEDLIDDVGYSLYARCEAIQMVTERRCPHCHEKLTVDTARDGLAACPGCKWTMPWKRFKRSYKGHRIHGGRAYPLFLKFMSDFRLARAPRDKLLAIDLVIHAVHEDASKVWTIPASCNLIEGTQADILELLDGLAYGDTSTPGLSARKAEWRHKIREGQAATDEHYRGREGYDPRRGVETAGKK